MTEPAPHIVLFIEAMVSPQARTGLVALNSGFAMLWRGIVVQTGQAYVARHFAGIPPDLRPPADA